MGIRSVFPIEMEDSLGRVSPGPLPAHTRPRIGRLRARTRACIYSEQKGSQISLHPRRFSLWYIYSFPFSPRSLHRGEAIKAEKKTKRRARQRGREGIVLALIRARKHSASRVRDFVPACLNRRRMLSGETVRHRNTSNACMPAELTFQNV